MNIMDLAHLPGVTHIAVRPHQTIIHIDKVDDWHRIHGILTAANIAHTQLSGYSIRIDQAADTEGRLITDSEGES